MKSSFSLVGLKRWSCKSREIPSIPTIKAIHVYDFDNTLFSSPLPNPQIWSPSTIGMLNAYETLAYGGWWHDPSILESTGDGLEAEEPRAWEGWWNETVVQLVQLSIQSKDVLTVLLTGRGETNFAGLVNRICHAKGLDFDLVVLKPEVGPAGQRFESTMAFKQEFLRELVFTYKQADEVRIYEDRTKHVKGFREHFERLNKSLLSHPADQPPPPRKPITAEVIHVCELKSTLHPETELEVVAKAVRRHNDAIVSGGPNPTKAISRQFEIVRHFAYFGYLINQSDSARLITLCNTPHNLVDSGEVRLLASTILITPHYPPSREIMDKVGGEGKKVTWQVTGIAKFEDRIWAAKVAPVSDTQVHTLDPTPLVVLAIRKGSRPVDAGRIQNWAPVAPEKAFMFETTVDKRVTYAIEEPSGGGQPDHTSSRLGRRGGGGGAQYASEWVEAGNKRKYQDTSDFRRKENNHRGGGDRPPGGRFAQRNAMSKAQFNNRGNNQNSNQPGARGNAQGGANGPARQRGNGGPGAAGGGGGNRGRPGGGGGPGTGSGGPNNSNRGPPGYKSLDDYGPGNFDGSTDANSGYGGDVALNY
jgi:hypothetical protein